MAKQKRIKPGRSDRLRSMSARHGWKAAQGYTGDDMDRGDDPFDDHAMAWEKSAVHKIRSDARRSVERYLEDRALKEAIDDNMY